MVLRDFFVPFVVWVIFTGNRDSSEALLSSSSSDCASARSFGSSIFSATTLTSDVYASPGSLMRPSPCSRKTGGLEARTFLQVSMAYSLRDPLISVLIVVLLSRAERKCTERLQGLN